MWLFLVICHPSTAQRLAMLSYFCFAVDTNATGLLPAEIVTSAPLILSGLWIQSLSRSECVGITERTSILSDGDGGIL